MTINRRHIAGRPGQTASGRRPHIIAGSALPGGMAVRRFRIEGLRGPVLLLTELDYLHGRVDVQPPRGDAVLARSPALVCDGRVACRSFRRPSRPRITGGERRRLAVEDLLARFEDLRRELLDETAAALLEETYV